MIDDIVGAALDEGQPVTERARLALLLLQFEFEFDPGLAAVRGSTRMNMTHEHEPRKIERADRPDGANGSSVTSVADSNSSLTTNGSSLHATTTETPVIYEAASSENEYTSIPSTWKRQRCSYNITNKTCRNKKGGPADV